MLNDLIRKTNVLGRDYASSRAAGGEITNPSAFSALERDYKTSLDQTLRFVADNNVPRDTVAIIEDRILRELRVRDDEAMLRSQQAAAAATLRDAHKEVDWLQRSVDSGLGCAQARFIQAKAKMDDFAAESARLSYADRSVRCSEFARLDKEYVDSKSEFLRVGVTDRAALLNELAAAKQNLEEAKAAYSYAESQVGRLPLSSPITTVKSGSGEICRALDGTSIEDFEEPEIFAAEVIDDDEPTVQLPQVKGDSDILTGTIVSNDQDELSVQISAAVKSMLGSNERFKYILEEVRFQASMEVAKVRAEVEKIRNDAFKEAQKLTEELRKLKDDASFIRQEAARARIAMNTVNRAKATATLNAQRTVNAARKTVAAARRAIDAAKTATVHRP